MSPSTFHRRIALILVFSLLVGVTLHPMRVVGGPLTDAMLGDGIDEIPVNTVIGADALALPEDAFQDAGSLPPPPSPPPQPACLPPAQVPEATMDDMMEHIRQHPEKYPPLKSIENVTAIPLGEDEAQALGASHRLRIEGTMPGGRKVERDFLFRKPAAGAFDAELSAMVSEQYVPRVHNLFTQDGRPLGYTTSLPKGKPLSEVAAELSITQAEEIARQYESMIEDLSVRGLFLPETMDGMFVDIQQGIPQLQILPHVPVPGGDSLGPSPSFSSVQELRDRYKEFENLMKRSSADARLKRVGKAVQNFRERFLQLREGAGSQLAKEVEPLMKLSRRAAAGDGVAMDALAQLTPQQLAKINDAANLNFVSRAEAHKVSRLHGFYKSKGLHIGAGLFFLAMLGDAVDLWADEQGIRLAEAEGRTGDAEILKQQQRSHWAAASGGSTVAAFVLVVAALGTPVGWVFDLGAGALIALGRIFGDLEFENAFESIKNALDHTTKDGATLLKEAVMKANEPGEKKERLEAYFMKRSYWPGLLGDLYGTDKPDIQGNVAELARLSLAYLDTVAGTTPTDEDLVLSQAYGRLVFMEKIRERLGLPPLAPTLYPHEEGTCVPPLPDFARNPLNAGDAWKMDVVSVVKRFRRAELEAGPQLLQAHNQWVSFLCETEGACAQPGESSKIEKQFLLRDQLAHSFHYVESRIPVLFPHTPGEDPPTLVKRNLFRAAVFRKFEQRALGVDPFTMSGPAFADAIESIQQQVFRDAMANPQKTIDEIQPKLRQAVIYLGMADPGDPDSEHTLGWLAIGARACRDLSLSMPIERMNERILKGIISGVTSYTLFPSSNAPFPQFWR